MTSDNRYQNLLIAVEYERDAEEAYYRSLSADKTLAEKRDAGILWYPLMISRKSYTVGERIELVLEKQKPDNQPHKFKSGMGCIVFRSDGTSTQEVKGVISYVKRDKISIILNENAVEKSQVIEAQGQIGAELIFDERPYSVMKAALKEVMKSSSPRLKNWREGIANLDSFSYKRSDVSSYSPSHLNSSQLEAYDGALVADQMCIIHGPPGTGKTTTLVAIVRELVKKEKRVLVCAPSNNAVDHLAMHLAASGTSVLRIGNVTRVSDDLTHLTLAEKAREHPEWQHIKKIRIEAQEARRQAQKFKRSFGAKERANRTSMYREARDLESWAREVEHKLMDRLVHDAQVICSTLIGVSHKSITELNFKTVVIDEASQALEPECWNAILRAERVILAGDHLQLAPTVKSSQAITLGLADTLLTRMTEYIKHSFLLTVQYRMNQKILSFSNKMFYGGKLTSGEGIGNRTLKEDDKPLLLIDTSGCGFDESYNPKSRSRYNEGEYFILREHVIQNTSMYKEATIGIISPYGEQVKYLNSKIAEDSIFAEMNISVNSIDGFQGQERDVIYISLVRSNLDGEIGFLKDERRLNVAMTRARKKMVIIGDMSTLAQTPLFESLAVHFETYGSYQSAWEYMAI